MLIVCLFVHSENLLYFNLVSLVSFCMIWFFKTIICYLTLSAAQQALIVSNENYYSSFLIPHSSFLIPHSSFLIPHSSFLIPHPHSSFLIPPSSFLIPLIPHSSFLIPHSSFLILIPLHSSFLIPHSLILIPHSSFLIPHSSFLIPSFLIPYSLFLTRCVPWLLLWRCRQSIARSHHMRGRNGCMPRVLW